MYKGTIIRIFVLVVALVNQLLVSLGLTAISGDEGSWYEVISIIFPAVAAIIAWFKNNYVSAKGKKQKEVLKKNGLTIAK